MKLKFTKPLWVALVVIGSFAANGQGVTKNLDKAQLDSILIKAKNSHGDGLIILQGDRIVVEEYFGQPLTPTYIASVSKALVAIAITKLLSDGKIKSIDQPVADFYPEWKQGQKRDITLRMLLSHTSGIQNEKNSRLEIETGPQGSGDDLVKLALAAEISEKPGTVYRYNNKATCLLPGIVEVASGLRLDKYFEQEFFPYMNITNYEWKRDATGRPQGHGGFRLLPKDLAKFGQLMLNKGEWNGKRFFEARWADSAVVPSQLINTDVGLIWHRYQKINRSISLQKEKIAQLLPNKNDSLSYKLRNIKDTFASETELSVALQNLFGNNWMPYLQSLTKGLPNGIKDLFFIGQDSSQFQGYFHTGSWGNYLVIVPGLNLVAVRLVKRDKDYNHDTDLYGEFVKDVFGLLKN